MAVEMAASTDGPRLSYTSDHVRQPSFTPSVIDGPRSVSIHPPAPPLTAPMVVATRNRLDVNASDSVHPASVSEADLGSDLPSSSASYQSGLTSPFAMFPSRSIGNKAVIGSTFAVPMHMDVVTHVEDSLKILRNEAESITAKPGQLQDALNAWRDAVLVDLNATVEQNSTTSVQADETLKMLAKTGYLTDFLAMMRNECNSSPNELESWRILGHASLVEGDVAGAVDAWMHVTDSSDAVAEDWYQLGLAWEADQNKAGAVGAYAKVLDLNEPSRAADAQARMTALSH
jgi:tetratricopeptide (TPR) repeat protein